MQRLVARDQVVQVVRDGLVPAVAVVTPILPEVLDHGVLRCRWELVWRQTPHGPIAAHYVEIRSSDGCRSAEAFLPHTSGPSPHPQAGYWILRRLAHLRECLLVLWDGHTVRHLARYRFPRYLRRRCSRISRELVRQGPLLDLVQARRAALWHTETFNRGRLG
jgi:hypothetical protein